MIILRAKKRKVWEVHCRNLKDARCVEAAGAQLKVEPRASYAPRISESSSIVDRLGRGFFR